MKSTLQKIVTPDTLPPRDNLGKIGLCTRLLRHPPIRTRRLLRTVQGVLRHPLRHRRQRQGRRQTQTRPPTQPRPQPTLPRRRPRSRRLRPPRRRTPPPRKIDCSSFCDRLTPDVYILNDDDSGLHEKRAFCQSRGITLQLVSRTVPDGLIPTSTTEIAEKLRNAG